MILVILLNDKQSFSDISIIIKMMSPYMQSRISNKFIQFIEENKDPSYHSSIEVTQPLENQTLSHNTKVLLALIYRDFLCSKNERKNFIFKQIENQNKITENNKEKYKINFKKNKNTNINSIIEYKKVNIFVNFFNKLKKFLHLQK